MSTLIVASVGTYHQPFDRFVDWMESYLEGRDDVRVIFQHGVTRPMRGAENHEMLPLEELLDLYERADALVLQGGAGGLMDSRVAGRKPIVVPRDPELNEHVDDHQLVATEHMEGLGLMHRVTTQDQLHDLLAEVEAGTLSTRTLAQTMPGTAAACRALVRTAHLGRRRPQRFRRAATLLLNGAA